MFNNLAAEIARKGVKNNDFAEKVGIHPVTFSKKLNGKTDFTLKEVIRIIEYAVKYASHSIRGTKRVKSPSRG